MNERQGKLLVAIIDQFIETASPIGSKSLIEAGLFECSSATLRSEMGVLEDEGFLEQPHISAGRTPTAKGYRAYVQQYMEPTKHQRSVQKEFNSLKEQYFHRKDQERVYEAVALLSRMIPNIAFATVPHKHRVYYLGLANALKQPEFLQNPMLASGIVEVLEGRLDELLSDVEIDDKVRYYIGEHDLLGNVDSCALMVTEYRVRDLKGTLGILGPMRMDYGYNTVALKLAADLLRSYA